MRTTVVPTLSNFITNKEMDAIDVDREVTRCVNVIRFVGTGILESGNSSSMNALTGLVYICTTRYLEQTSSSESVSMNKSSIQQDSSFFALSRLDVAKLMLIPFCMAGAVLVDPSDLRQSQSLIVSVRSSAHTETMSIFAPFFFF